MIFSSDEIHAAASKLRPILNKMLVEKQGEIADILKARDEVISRYQPIFSFENIHSITEEDYRSFLIFSNNKHWNSLQRMGPAQTVDMDLLRKALSILVDENRSIKERLDTLLGPSGAMIPRLGPATLTPILLVVYPDKYGVLNNPAKAGLRKLGLWPKFDRETPFSEKYIEINQIYQALTTKLGIDLWTLDALWWAVLIGEEITETGYEQLEDELILPGDIDIAELPRFGLEHYLQEFLRDNWERIPALSDWVLYEEDGDLVGYEYNTGEIGRIDLLARHKREPQWLVIELKRNQGSDQTIGQVLRYMGWVEANLKEPGEEVLGLVICNTSEPALEYALKHTHNVDMMLYEVQFNLHKPEIKK